MKITTNNLDKILSTMQKTFIGGDYFLERIAKNAKNAMDVLSNYPPYNIIQITDNEYKIEFALAGFAKDDIEIIQEKNIISIYNKDPDYGITVDDNLEVSMVYQGIAKRSFKKQFTLSEYIKVKNATMKDGILKIVLERKLPENGNIKKIKIL